MAFGWISAWRSQYDPSMVSLSSYTVVQPLVPVALICLLGYVGRGKLYSLFDGKILYIIGVFLFEGGSALCGAAPTMDALVIGRTICGVGGSGMYIGGELNPFSLAVCCSRQLSGLTTLFYPKITP